AARAPEWSHEAVRQGLGQSASLVRSSAEQRSTVLGADVSTPDGVRADRPGELLDGAPGIGDLDPRTGREGGELLDGHDAVVTAVPQQNARRPLQAVDATL